MPTESLRNIQWCLTSRPSAEVAREHFEVRESSRPEPGAGEVLVRNIYLMVPASMRLWMNERESYFPSQPLGEVMRGITLGAVMESKVPTLPVGTYVNGMGGWQTFYLAKAEELMPFEPHPQIPLAAYRTVLDLQGLTAYGGLIEVGRPVAGETLVVTAAAGSLGSLVCQIGKKLGLRVIGIAGTREKCDWLVKACGIDGAICYRSEDVGARLDALCPNGINIAFESVGGPVMDLIIERIAMHARIALSGLVASYNSGRNEGGRSLMNLVNKRGRIQGFLALDYMPRYAEIMAQLKPWVLNGSLKYEVEILDDLERACEAMNRLFRGEHRGMQLIRISDDSRQ